MSMNREENPPAALEETGLNPAADTPGPEILTATLSEAEGLSEGQPSERFFFPRPGGPQAMADLRHHRVERRPGLFRGLDHVLH